MAPPLQPPPPLSRPSDTFLSDSPSFCMSLACPIVLSLCYSMCCSPARDTFSESSPLFRRWCKLWEVWPSPPDLGLPPMTPQWHLLPWQPHQSQWECLEASPGSCSPWGAGEPLPMSHTLQPWQCPGERHEPPSCLEVGQDLSLPVTDTSKQVVRGRVPDLRTGHLGSIKSSH